MSSPPSTFLRLTPDTPFGERRQSTFLSLAPSTSSSYPRVQASRASVSEGEAPVEVPRRKSSPTAPKILKLGPVHWGEHLSEHKDDFHEIISR